MGKEVRGVLERIPDVPEPVLGFRASGELTGDDYRNVLLPAVETALQNRDKLRLLYVLGEDVTGFSAGAAWQDTKVGMEHVTRWEKIAVVTDQEWLRRSVNVFGYLIPGEIKAFPATEEADARTWVAS
jgi:hypothetical protein